MIFYPGQRVVCINDFFMRDELPVGITKPVEGMIYTVKDIVRSEKDVDDYLVQFTEINNHVGQSARFEGFQMSRFRSLDNIKASSDWAVDVLSACTTGKLFDIIYWLNKEEKGEDFLILDVFLIEIGTFKTELLAELKVKGVLFYNEGKAMRICCKTPDAFASLLSGLQEMQPGLWLIFLNMITERWRQINMKNNHLHAEVWQQYDDVLQLYNFRIK